MTSRPPPDSPESPEERPDSPEERPTSDEPDEGERQDDAGRSAKAAAMLGAALALGALGTHGPRAAASVLVGAAIAVANLLTMRAIIRALIQAPAEPEDTGTRADHERTGRRGGAAWALFAALKIVILFGGVWFLLTRELVDPMALVIGYGVLPLGIVASALWSSLGDRTRDR
ncbi:MAG: ATP synthase subunit I [Labilithrix sp.]|nr:ATP synthase subunit I [Labilithrix sp.]